MEELGQTVRQPSVKYTSKKHLFINAEWQPTGSKKSDSRSSRSSANNGLFPLDEAGDPGFMGMRCWRTEDL